MQDGIFILLLTAMFAIAFVISMYVTPRLFHFAFKHHWPFYKYIGKDSHGFVEHGDVCLRCHK